jgi:HK97 family phage major capsid protein
MSELETKGATSNVGEAFEDFMRAFEAFKETNDERLYALERRGYADPLIEEKLNRIDRALDDNRRVVDELALKSARPPLGASAVRTGAAREYAAAFQAYVRKGEPGRLRDLESKALSVGSDPDGGYLVPDETETAVNRAVKDISPIRAISGVRQVSGSVYKRPFAITGAATGWVAETADRTQTNAPTLDELKFETMDRIPRR